MISGLNIYLHEKGLFPIFMVHLMPERFSASTFAINFNRFREKNSSLLVLETSNDAEKTLAFNDFS